MIINNNKFVLFFLLSFLIVHSFINKVESANGFGLINPNATCSQYIGDPDDLLICNGKLLNSDSIYNENQSTQLIGLKKLEVAFQKLTFLQGSCPNINFSQFGFCNLLLWPCETVQLPARNVSFPKRVCKSTCLSITAECPVLSSYFNCSDDNVFPDTYNLYNATAYGFTANSGFYPIQCANVSDLFIKNSANTRVSEVCPSPLILRNSSDPKYSADKGYTYLSPTNCVLGCPAPYYSEKKWNQMYTMSKIVSTISFVCCIYNICTFGVFNKNISKYNYCIVFFSASVALMNLMDIVTYGIGYEKVLCPEIGRSAVQEDAACGVTGSLFHLGVTNGVLWWTTMAIYLLSVVKRIKMIDFRFFIVFNSIISIIMLIIPLSGKAIMAGTGSLGCWIRKTWYTNSVFWIPLGLCLFIGSGCIALVIYQIYKISKNVSKDNKILQLQLKPFLCVTLIGGSFLYLFIFYFDNERHMDEYKASIFGYVQCLLAGGNEDTCLSEGPNYAAYFIFYFFIRLFGILFFCIYGTSENARNIWIHSSLLNHSAIKPFLLKYNLVNFNSVTVFGSGMGGNTTNSKSTNSKKQNNNGGNNSERGVELDANDSVSISRNAHTVSVSKVDENDDSKSGSGMDSSDS